jgi:small subunit ribosomal protein S20
VANHKSAFKRARQSEVKRLRNKTVKTRIKSVIKEVRQTAGNASSEQSLSTLNMAKSAIGKAVKKGVVHKRTAARKISRLSKLENKASL